MASPKENFKTSIDFLKRFHPGRLWVLTAIQPDHKKIETATFDETAEADLLKWLTVHKKKNIYFSVAEPMRPLDKKAERADIKAVHWLHVDLDPRAGEDLGEERERILATLKKAVPVPTVIVFSGGGYQGFWRLKEPIPIDGNLEKAEDAKLYNQQLELTLGGDQCHNVDRIMRLPGSVNRPNKRKREKGRTEELAKTVKGSGKSYDLKDFTQAVAVQNGAQQATAVEVSGNIERLNDVNDLGPKVKDLVKVVIVQGMDPDNPNKWPSRSEAVFWVCCELMRAEIDEKVIFSILTDPGFGISESVLEKKSNAVKYALRQIERALENAIDPWLQRLNEEYAFIENWGGKTRILQKSVELIGRRERPCSMAKTIQEFKDINCNKFVVTGTNQKTGEQIMQEAGKWWLKHPARRQYKRVVFTPGQDREGEYNLWTGFAYNASPGGDCSLYLNHIKKNVCSNDDERFNYLMGWMASAVQHPDRPGHTAVVLRGRQGTGKGRFATIFGDLFGRHFLPISDSRYIFGFNGMLWDCSVLFADECFATNNPKHVSALKSLITEQTIVCEKKGLDAEIVPNYIHLIMASNEDWAVSVQGDDRRFLVLDVADNNRKDREYFNSMQAQMDAGGYEALLHLLMVADLSEFNIENIPQTKALRDQKVSSLNDEQGWWYEKLQNGRILDTEDAWPEKVFCSELCHDFILYNRNWNSAGDRSSATMLGCFMKTVFPKGWKCKKQLGGTHHIVGADGIGKEVPRPTAYLIPPLGECRKIWDAKFGGPYNWNEIEEEEEEVSNGELYENEK